MPEKYSKPALTFPEQLSKLQKRGLLVSDENEALRQLSSISYYRLSSYWYPFRQRDQHGNLSSKLVEGTCIEQVIDLYEFDRRLRSLVMDALERIEISIRTQITYHFGHQHGAFGHIDPSHFHPKFDHTQWLSKLEKETKRSSDEFIRHYKKKYNGFPHIPIWMLTEVMSFGSLSFFYKGLINNQKSGVEDKKVIANHYGFHHKRFGDWLHTLTYVRNICAHHSRLWNRELSIRPDQAREKAWLSPITPRNDRIFYILLMLRYLMRCSGNGDDWAKEVIQVLEPFTEYNQYRIAMGIPENWKEHPIWK